MATYYKYAERSADSQVNWSQVGKGISDMLTEEVKLREEKKAAYEEAYRIDTERLVNAPQGTWQDGNATVNNFAHDMMAQQLIDYRLLKSGVMNERDYTLRRENYKSGTNTVFDLQKILQAEKAKTIESYQKGEIQALNISNMADVEGYTDFANSKIEIDPYNPNINMSIYETKMVDGKEVRVLKKTSPVNVLKGQLLQKIPAFKLDEAVTKDVNSLGDGSDFLYEAATTSRAGSITKLIGYGAIIGEYAKKDKDGNPLYPQFASEVGKMKDAITQTVNKYFSDPYAVSSILTENTGNYSAESYTVYKEEAAKDKTKLLKKLDPMTGQYVLDKDGPHYKEQEQEAREYVEKLILSKLDAKRELATTAQTQAQYAPEYVTRGRADAQAQEVAAGYWNDILSAKNVQEAQAAADVLIGTPRAIEMGLTKMDFTSNPGSVILNYDNPAMNRAIKMFDDSGNPVNRRDWAALGVELHGVADREKAIKAGGGAKEYGGLKKEDYMNVGTERQGTPPTPPKLSSIPTDALEMESPEAAATIQASLPSGFTVRDLTPSEWNAENKIEIEAPNGEKLTIFTDIGKEEATLRSAQINAWLKANNVTPATPPAGTGGTAAASGTAATGTLNATNRKPQ
jgi:hypothetical protein